MTVDGTEPITCSLEPAALADRRALWLEIGNALRELNATRSGVRLVYEGSDGIEQQLRRLARLEGECCSFAEWRVSRRGDELTLEVMAEPGEGAVAVRALFGVS